ncbi:MAG: hypothetical protein GMKNLPBB_00426 [Myxococcota bacterium]|nr:hypothetical protein [Myxococcota bacterium]
MFHFAFLVVVKAHPEQFRSVNVGGSKNVFMQGQAAGVNQFIYSSSIAAYGVVPGHPEPIVEDTPRRHQPEFPYSACKYEVEAFLDEYERNFPDIRVARLRPTILVGEYMEHGFGKLTRKRIFPDPNGAVVPVVWDEDVADAAMSCFRRKAHGAFILTAEGRKTGSELGRELGFRVIRPPEPLMRAALVARNALAGVGIGQSIDPAWMKQGGVNMIASSAKAREMLDWKPKCPGQSDVFSHFLQTVPYQLDPRIAWMIRLAGLASKRRPPLRELENLRGDVHVHLTGPKGGDIRIHVEGGRLGFGFGVPRPPTSVVTMKAELWLDMMAGKTDFSAALISNRVRIEGEPFAGFIVGGLMSEFGKLRRMDGKRGEWARRATSRIFG